jgi:hypothetical protein
MKTKRTEKEDPETNPHSYSHLIFDKVPKTYIEDKTASSKYHAGKIECPHVED